MTAKKPSDPLRRSKVKCSSSVKEQATGDYSHTITVTVKLPRARGMTSQQVAAWAKKTAAWCQQTADAILGDPRL